jgi:hypothetical protein
MLRLSEQAAAVEIPRSAARLGIRLLHPAFLFGLVWAVGLGGWLLTSPDWFLRVAAAEKHVSASSMFFFTLCIGMFLLGVVLGPPLLRASQRAVAIRPSDLSADEVDVLRRRTYIWFGIGAVCALYLLAAGTLRFGGPSALISFVSSGGSLEELSQQYFEPSRRAGMTVWIHALVAVGPLTTVAAVLVRDRSVARRLVAVNAATFVLVFLNSLAFAERLITFGYVVASAVAWVGVRPWSVRTRSTASWARSASRVALVVALVAGLWIGGEFSRTYLATRQTEAPISASDVLASVPLAAERFLAYMTTSVNNGLYAVDHSSERSLILNTGSAFVTAAGLDHAGAPLVGVGVAERDEMLWQIFPYHTPLTTFSMPGDVFQDLGWIGPALIFWFGVIAGGVYARFRQGELWALLVYPLIVAGILDSYRILYWTRTEMVLPVVVVTLVCLGWYRARREAPVASPARAQSTPMSAR